MNCRKLIIQNINNLLWPLTVVGASEMMHNNDVAKTIHTRRRLAIAVEDAQEVGYL